MRDKAFVLTTGPLFSCRIFFPFFYVLGDLDVLQHASKEAGGPFVFEVFTLEGHGIRCVCVCVCVCVESDCDSLKGRGAGLARTERNLG